MIQTKENIRGMPTQYDYLEACKFDLALATSIS